MTSQRENPFGIGINRTHFSHVGRFGEIWRESQVNRCHFHRRPRKPSIATATIHDNPLMSWDLKKKPSLFLTLDKCPAESNWCGLVCLHKSIWNRTPACVSFCHTLLRTTAQGGRYDCVIHHTGKGLHNYLQEELNLEFDSPVQNRKMHWMMNLRRRLCSIQKWETFIYTLYS